VVMLNYQATIYIVQKIQASKCQVLRQGLHGINPSQEPP
jgi:hypothetical protein